MINEVGKMKESEKKQQIVIGIANQMKKTYIDFGGVYNWEYFNSPPNGVSDPNQWAVLMNKTINPRKLCCFL